MNNAEYYKANLVCVIHVLDEFFLHDAFIENLKKYEPEKKKDVVVYNYFTFIGEILFHMVYLLRNYDENILKTKNTKYRLGKAPFQSSFTLYQLLPQTIFGQASFHSFIEREPYVSISLIRQVLELKIRRSFGVLGLYNKVTDSFEPLGMSKIFEVIKTKEKDIDFAVPLNNIIRIYSWANIFVHSGLKDFIWVPIFVYRYIHELIKGKKGSYNVHSGIQVKNETIKEIYLAIESTLHPSCILQKGKPEATIKK